MVYLRQELKQPQANTGRITLTPLELELYHCRPDVKKINQCLHKRLHNYLYFVDNGHTRHRAPRTEKRQDIHFVQYLSLTLRTKCSSTFCSPIVRLTLDHGGSHHLIVSAALRSTDTDCSSTNALSYHTPTHPHAHYSPCGYRFRAENKI